MPSRLLLFTLVVGCGNNIAVADDDGRPHDLSESDRGRRALRLSVVCAASGCDAWASAARWRETILGTYDDAVAREGDCEVVQTHFVHGGWE